MSAYGDLAPFYDGLTGDVDYEAFAGFYEKVFSMYAVYPETVLDLACGTGTLTCLLAQRGYEMIGTDASADMLSVAQTKAGELSESAKQPMFLCQPMEELDLYGTVGAAVCSLDGLDYVPANVLPEVFRRLHLFIEPGGVLVFDVNTPEKLRGLDGQMFVDENDDVFCVWRAEFDEEENACFYGMDIFSRAEDMWERSFEEHVEYAHGDKLLCGLLEQAGFSEIRVFEEGTDDAMPQDGGRIFISARRK